MGIAIEKLVSESNVQAEIEAQLRAVHFSGKGKVIGLLEKPGSGIHASRKTVRVITGRGFEGDHHKKDYWRGERIPGREVTMIAKEVLDVLGIDFLTIGDNIVSSGIDLSQLEAGQLVQVGPVRLKRSEKPHQPCQLFANRTSLEAMEAVKATGMRGALFYVLSDGVISVEDEMVTS